MPKNSEILGSQDNSTGDSAGGFLAGTREVFDSATSSIRGASDAVDEFLGLGPGEERPILRSSQLAHKTFGQDGAWLKQSQPLLGFQYFVKINSNGNLADFVKSYFPETSFESNFPLVKSITMPSIGVESEIFNEYNRKRISQTKLKFDPIDIVFHDVANGNTMKLWQMYYQYYFADGRFDKPKSASDAPVNPVDFDARNFGYDISRVEDLRYLYKSIEIFQLSGGYFNKVTLYNPKIVDFKHDTMSYEKNDLVEVSYTLDYEWAEYEFRLKNKDGNALQVKNEQDIFDYLGQSNFVEYKEFDPGYKPDKEEGYPDGILGDIEEVVDTVQTGIETVEAAKGFARNVAGKVQSVSSFANQIQKDVLGVDEPPFPAPDVRGFTSKIDNIPTSYPDVRRVRKGGG